jgi:hypothetical protein
MAPESLLLSAEYQLPGELQHLMGLGRMMRRLGVRQRYLRRLAFVTIELWRKASTSSSILVCVKVSKHRCTTLSYCSRPMQHMRCGEPFETSTIFFKMEKDFFQIVKKKTCKHKSRQFLCCKREMQV